MNFQNMNDIARNFENNLTEKEQVLICDDTENKRWIIFCIKDDMGKIQNGQYKIMPYGQISCDVWNDLVEVKANSPHLNNSVEVLTSMIGKETTNASISAVQGLLSEYATDFDILKNTLLSNGGKITAAFDKYTLDYIWRIFRYATVSDWLESVLCWNKEDSKLLYSLDYDNFEKVFHSHVCVSCGIYPITDDNNNTFFCRCYSATNETAAFYYDYLYVLLSAGEKKKNKIVECPRCGRLYFSQSNNFKYCPKCSRKEIALENRNKSVRKIHKQIQDKLHGRMVRKNNPLPADEYENFLKESNYYWDIVRGKDVAPDPKFSSSIKTEKQYEKWLTKKLNSL